MKTVSVKLPEALAEWLLERSKALQRTQSQLVRELLERERNGNGRSKTCGELLRDLDGFFDGPQDLSANPKYLEGFGQ
jgi:hypothetical protein